jgi:nitroreductase
MFCEEEIRRLLRTKNKLVAIISLGYPAEKGKRSRRKPVTETVKYF